MSDTYKKLKCPACQREMKKFFIREHEINIDICLDGCGGIWFDKNELNHFDEKHESIDEILAAIEGKTFTKVDESSRRFCPACGTRMAKSFSSIKAEIQVDECLACGGKFLDNSELQAIRAEYKNNTDRNAAIIALMRGSKGAQIDRLRSRL